MNNVQNNIMYLSELADRNSYFLNNSLLPITYKNVIFKTSLHEYSKATKFLLFLILFFVPISFNKLKFSQLILSSNTKKNEELVHKTSLLAYHKMRFTVNMFNSRFKNIFTITSLLIHYLNYTYTGVTLRHIQFFLYGIAEIQILNNTVLSHTAKNSKTNFNFLIRPSRFTIYSNQINMLLSTLLI